MQIVMWIWKTTILVNLFAFVCKTEIACLGTGNPRPLLFWFHVAAVAAVGGPHRAAQRSTVGRAASNFKTTTQQLCNDNAVALSGLASLRNLPVMLRKKPFLLRAPQLACKS